MNDLSATAEFYQYCVRTSPQGCLDIVLACASDGEMFWEGFLAHGLVDAIAASARLERRFFKQICVDSIAPHGGPILVDYLRRLPPQHLARFFSSDQLKSKDHPVNAVFAAARQKTPTGAVAQGMLDTFIDHGLHESLLVELAKRRHQDVRLACMAGNTDFLLLLFSRLKPIPSQLLRYVVADGHHGVDLVGTLIRDGVVPVATFEDPQLLQYATESVRDLIAAIHVRNVRVSPRARYR